MTPSDRDRRVMTLYGMRKHELVTLLAEIKTSKGLRLIYGTPYSKWKKDDLVSEILREEGWNQNR